MILLSGLPLAIVLGLLLAAGLFAAGCTAHTESSIKLGCDPPPEAPKCQELPK